MSLLFRIQLKPTFPEFLDWLLMNFENKDIDYLAAITRYMEIILIQLSRAIRIGKNLGYKRNLDWVLPQITDYINQKIPRKHYITRYKQKLIRIIPIFCQVI